MKSCPTDGTTAAAATEIRWGTSLAQSEEESEVEKRKAS